MLRNKICSNSKWECTSVQIENQVQNLVIYINRWVLFMNIYYDGYLGCKEHLGIL